MGGWRRLTMAAPKPGISGSSGLRLMRSVPLRWSRVQGGGWAGGGGRSGHGQGSYSCTRDHTAAPGTGACTHAPLNKPAAAQLQRHKRDEAILGCPPAHLTARLDTFGTMRVALPPAGSSIARKMLAAPAQR